MVCIYQNRIDLLVLQESICMHKWVSACTYVFMCQCVYMPKNHHSIYPKDDPAPKFPLILLSMRIMFTQLTILTPTEIVSHFMKSFEIVSHFVKLK